MLGNKIRFILIDRLQQYFLDQHQQIPEHHMKGNTELNVQIRLTKTPTANYPNKETDIFQIKYTAPVPTDRVKDGELVIRNQYISIDAAMRTWITTKTYMDQIMPGDVMVAQTVGKVIYSKSKKFQVGDVVLAMGGWQKFSVLPEKQVHRIPKEIKNPELFLALSISGLTAYFGLENIGKIKQKDVVVISAAAGGVGQIAIQYAKAKGCIVCGIAGGEQKCKFVKSLGADYVINYKSESVKDKLRDFFKSGIDVYLDNVGGEMLDDVLMNIKDESRIVLCGAISNYNNLGPNQNNNDYYRLKNYPRLIIKRATMKGFVVVDFVKEFPKAYQELFGLIGEGKLNVKIDLSQGIDECPAALIKLLTGKNTGKVLVKVSEPQAKL